MFDVSIKSLRVLLLSSLTADSDVCITVTPGTPTFKVKGRTIYDFDVKWARDKDRKDVKSYKTYVWGIILDYLRFLP